MLVYLFKTFQILNYVYFYIGSSVKFYKYNIMFWIQIFLKLPFFLVKSYNYPEMNEICILFCFQTKP